MLPAVLVRVVFDVALLTALLSVFAALPIVFAALPMVLTALLVMVFMLVLTAVLTLVFIRLTFVLLAVVSPHAIPKALSPRTVESAITFFILIDSPVFFKD